MNEHDWLAGRFETHRDHLRAVAYRMLGSLSEADDAVQESWLRLSRTDTSDVENLGGWLTTVVARVSLDMLRARKSRGEESLGADAPEPLLGRGDGGDPEHEAVLADSVGLALLVVLETLAPPERLAFVLHDLFAVPFDEIAPIVGRSPAAARQLASRARRRVQGAPAASATDRSRQRAVVDAFLAASREGDLTALLALLDPDVVLRADPVAVAASATREAQGAPKLAPEVRGADAVAEVFAGRARVVRPVLIAGVPGAAWVAGGQPRAVFAFEIVGDRIVAVELIHDPARIGQLEVTILDD